MFQFPSSTKPPRPYTCKVSLSSPLAFQLIRRYTVNSLFQTAPPCLPCTSIDSTCYGLFCEHLKQCKITTEYGSHEFSFSHLNEIPDLLNMAPKLYCPFVSLS